MEKEEKGAGGLFSTVLRQASVYSIGNSTPTSTSIFAAVANEPRVWAEIYFTRVRVFGRLSASCGLFRLCDSTM